MANVLEFVGVLCSIMMPHYLTCVYHESGIFFLSKTTGGVNLIGLLDVVDEQVFFKWKSSPCLLFFHLAC